MRYAKFTVLFVLIAFGVARAEIFDLDNAPESEKIVITFTYKGIDLNNPPKSPYSLRYMVADASLEAVMEAKFVGEGPARHLESTVTSRMNNGFSTRLFYRFKPGKKLILDFFERSTFNVSGEKIITESFHVSKLIPPVSEKAIHPYSLPLALRGMDFSPGKKYNLYLWFNPRTVFAMDVTVKGEEEVTVPAGTFTCHRMEIVPDVVDLLGPIIGRMVKSLVPKVTVWLDKAPPHRLVKYRGPFGELNISSEQTSIFELKEIIH